MLANGYISCSSHKELINHVEMKKYVTYIRERYSEEDLDPTSLAVLIRFAACKFTSAYQVYKYLDNDKDDYVIATKKMKNKAHFIAYKNVSEKVQKLYSLGLIKVAKDEDTKHDAIYYRLTPYGLFYLFWKNSVLVLLHGREIFKNYKNDKLFHLFLYPCLTNLLDQIQNREVFDHIIDYLDKVCNTIIGIINAYMSKEKVKLFSWKKLLASDFLNDTLLEYLNLGLDLKWLDSENPLIEKKVRENMIKISGKVHSIIIMTDRKDKKKLNVIADDERFHEFELCNNGLITDNRPSASDSDAELDCRDLFSRTNLEIPSLFLSIMHNFATEIDNGGITHDCILFSKDRIFMDTLGKIVNNTVTTDIIGEYEKLSNVKACPTIPKIESSKIVPDASYGRRRRFWDLLERLDALNF